MVIGRSNYSEKILLHCHFVQHTNPIWTALELNPDLSSKKLVTK